MMGSPKTLLTWARVERLSCNDCSNVKLLIRNSSVKVAKVAPAFAGCGEGVSPLHRGQACPEHSRRDALRTASKMPALRIHNVRIHPMKRMHARLLLDAVTPAPVASRVQIFLDGLADSHIFNLNLSAEF